MTTTVRDPITPLPARRTRTRVLGVAGATLAALAVWIIAVPIAGIDLLVRPGSGSPQIVGAGTVLAASLIASFLGWVLLSVLEHHTAGARRVWTAVAVAVLLLSLGGPLSAGTTILVKVTLSLMHVAVGAVLITALRRSSPTG